MAGFADLVRSMVALADGLTSTLQAPVTHYAYAGATVDDSQKVTWGVGTVRLALVEDVNVIVKNAQGQMVNATTKVTFLRPVAVNARDKFILPDGRTAPVARIGGFTDPDAMGRSYLREVWLG